MKYLEICLVIISINLTLSLFVVTALWPAENIVALDTPEPVDAEGNLLNHDGLAYRVYIFSSGKYYINQGIQDTNQQYLQSGGDFLRGLNYFYETFIKGTVLVKPTLMALGIPENITFYIVYPVYFLYAMAIIQLVSGRTFTSTE